MLLREDQPGRRPSRPAEEAGTSSDNGFAIARGWRRWKQKNRRPGGRRLPLEFKRPL